MQAVESIKMLERRFDLFPAKFYWRGQVHNVDAVNECKTITSLWDDKTMYHYWVRCDVRLMHLCQEASGDWLVHNE